VPAIATIALGSNLGRREENVLRAVAAIAADRVGRPLRTSSLYQTTAVGMPGAPSFVNAVVQVVPLLPPHDLLQRLQAIEARMGRSGGHMQSREIDLDLIAFGDQVLDDPGLTLPHPRFHERAFVLIPLAEIDPAFACPRTGRRIGDLLAAVTGAGGVVRISGRSWIMRS